MKMRKGGITVDVPENGSDFYIRAGYEKVGGADTEPELVQLVNSAGYEIKPEPTKRVKQNVETPVEPEPVLVQEPVITKVVKHGRN